MPKPTSEVIGRNGNPIDWRGDAKAALARSYDARPAPFNKFNKILVLERFEFFPDRPWNRRREEFFYVLLESFQTHEHLGLHRVVNGVQMEDQKFNK